MATAIATGKTRGMGKRKQDANKLPPPDDGGPVLYIRMPPKVQAAFSAYLASDPIEPSRQSAGLEALTDFLKSKGFWPPPKES